MVETIQWTDAGVVMIDQTRLPREQSFVTCRTYLEVADAIKTMVIRGAPAIGVAAAMGVALGVQEGADFETVCKTLAATRPTAVNLFWGIERMRKLHAELQSAPRAEIIRRMIQEAKQIRVDDIATVDVVGRGRPLRSDPRLGPAGANVNFVGNPAAPGQPWPIRTYERGVEGETLACGTGTVAAGLALAASRESSLPARFRSRGGLDLEVRAAFSRDRVSDIWLGGQAKLLFRGVWEG